MLFSSLCYSLGSSDEVGVAVEFVPLHFSDMKCFSVWAGSISFSVSPLLPPFSKSDEGLTAIAPQHLDFCRRPLERIGRSHSGSSIWVLRIDELHNPFLHNPFLFLSLLLLIVAVLNSAWRCSSRPSPCGAVARR